MHFFVQNEISKYPHFANNIHFYKLIEKNYFLISFLPHWLQTEIIKSYCLLLVSINDYYLEFHTVESRKYKNIIQIAFLNYYILFSWNMFCCF